VVTREDKIEQTISNLVRQKLTDHDYIPEVVDLREAFPTADERAQELTKSQVAVGFSFDDGGLQAEMGTDLRVYTHTVEFWSFGIEARRGAQRRELHQADLHLEHDAAAPRHRRERRGGDHRLLEIPDARSISTTAADLGAAVPVGPLRLEHRRQDRGLLRGSGGVDGGVPGSR
jgi:hypothetical protein